MSQSQNLPELLQARLKLGLLNWGKRTVIWTLVLGLLTAMAPGLRFLLIAWLLFSALSLAALLLGLKLAKNLKVTTTAAFPSAADELIPEHPGETEATHRPIPRGGEIIDIEAEVIDEMPETKNR